MSDHNKPKIPERNPNNWVKVPEVKVPAGPNFHNRAIYDVGAFDKTIIQQGVRLQVYQTGFCPNVASIDSTEHDINCTVCLGNGFIDKYPLETYGLVVEATRNPNFWVEGYYEREDLNITFLSNVEVQYFTLIKLKDFSESFKQLVQKQQGPVDILKYNVLKVYLLVDSGGKEYFPVIDFIINADGNIQWNPGRGPAPFTIYSIVYDMQIQFRAMKANHAYRFTNPIDTDGNIKYVKLNQSWACSREYLVERQNFKKGKMGLPKIARPDGTGYINNPE